MPTAKREPSARHIELAQKLISEKISRNFRRSQQAFTKPKHPHGRRHRESTV